MWENLSSTQKGKYKTYITNFASLSEAFSQKEQDQESTIVAPIVNSKFQETVFQKAFGAVGEDIANTSYDSSLVVDSSHKYLVGIKSFGISSGDQKIAQFKNSSTTEAWEETLSEIRRVAEKAKSKEEADALNYTRYLMLAKRISILRNERILSSKEQIKGFDGLDEDVKSVYHVLMPSKKGDRPVIHVGETEYRTIDIENIEIIGSTTKNNPTNFKFTDGVKKYKYTSADSQLYMSFNNQEIIIDTWEVNYIEDPFYLFENLHLSTVSEVENDVIKPVETVSWMIYNKNGIVERNSGFNAFNSNTKYGKIERKKRLFNIYEKYKGVLGEKDSEYLKNMLEKILLKDWNSKELREERDKMRQKLSQWLDEINISSLTESVGSLIYRPIQEVYIPIPDSRSFHDSNPNFFGKEIGTFKDGTSSLKLPKENRIFKLMFLQSRDTIDAYINQDSGKSIQSVGRQDILGKWLIEGVFQLKPRELLTKKKLEDLGINGIRLSKFVEPEEYIGLEFIWIDEEKPPEDAMGWVSR